MIIKKMDTHSYKSTQTNTHRSIHPNIHTHTYTHSLFRMLSHTCSHTHTHTGCVASIIAPHTFVPHTHTPPFLHIKWCPSHTAWHHPSLITGSHYEKSLSKERDMNTHTHTHPT